MKNIKIVIFTIILFFTFFFPLKADWTYMVYIAADNSLSSAAPVDINEMETAADNANVDIIVLVDLKTAPGSDSKVYHIRHDNLINKITSPTIHSSIPWWPVDDELNTADWTVADSFFLWAMRNYPSDHYAITFWNHGGGMFKDNNWKGDTRAICWDDTDGNGDYIDNGEVREILNQLYVENEDSKIDLVGFDVCIQGAIESHFQIADYANVSVMSPANEPNNGWDWTFLGELTSTPTMNARTLGDHIVTYFGNFYPSTDATLSAIDCDTLLNIFMPSFNTFTSELYKYMYYYTPEIITCRQSCDTLINNDPNYGGPTPDLKEFINNIFLDLSLPSSLRNAALDLNSKFGRMIISNFSRGYTSNGATIWFPQAAPACGYSFAGDNWVAYNSMLVFDNTQWDEFLLEYADPWPRPLGYDSEISTSPTTLQFTHTLKKCRAINESTTQMDILNRHSNNIIKDYNKNIIDNPIENNITIRKFKSNNIFSDISKALEPETLLYYVGASYYWKCPDTYGCTKQTERFTPNYDEDSLIAFRFHTYSVQSGTPDIRIRVYNDNAGYPGTVLDSIDIPFDNIIWNDWNEVNLSSMGLVFNSGVDFYISVDVVVSSGDTISVLSDDGNSGSGRSYDFYNGAWETMLEGWGDDVDFLYEAILVHEYVPPIPYSSTFAISNGSSVIDKLEVYNILAINNSTWIDSIVPTRFNVNPGNSQIVTVYIDASGLAEGCYSDRLYILNSDDTDNPQIEYVSLDIIGSSNISISFDRDTVKIVYPINKTNKRETTSDNINDNPPANRICTPKDPSNIHLIDGLSIGNDFKGFRSQQQDILQYNVSLSYIWQNPDTFNDFDQGVRFTPTFDNETLSVFSFIPYDLLGGPFDIRVKVWDVGSDRYPNSVLGYIDIGTDTLNFHSGSTVYWNDIDLSSLGLVFNHNEDFYITLENLGSDGDTFTIISDNGTSYYNRSVEYYDTLGWGTMLGDWGAPYNFAYAAILNYEGNNTDTALFYIRNSLSSSSNLVVNDAYLENKSTWVKTISMPSLVAAPGESLAVYITVDTTGLLDEIYRDTIIFISNATNETKANNSIYILLDYNTGLHSGISTIVNKKLTSKLSLIATKNPFIHTTDLRFALPSECDVNITIYDISGKKLNELTNKKYTAGIYKIKWDGKDSNRKTLPSGFYFAKMTTGNKSLSTKIIKLH